MIDLDEIISSLDSKHRAALHWFRERTGELISWPLQLPDGTLLASKAKGIYKPAWTKYALSVRQSLDGPYADREPVIRPNGTWSYLYFQENPDPRQRDAEYTNRGLMECHNRRLPVGVIRQVRRKPTSQYTVLGLAMVSGWEDGYFLLEGFSIAGHAQDSGPAALIDAMIRDAQVEKTASGDFDPTGLADGRKRIIASVVQRQGQPAFRRALIKAYGGRCAVTDCDIEEALEAAHIVPYQGSETNHVKNGLLLRSDVHTLFDLGLISIDSGSMTLVIGSGLLESSYKKLAGRRIRLPHSPQEQPSKAALEYHRSWAGL